ncbi:MAG: hypothetical protein K2L75_04210, partial [Muribaculaceae bacterium]|nr:hypothetical protein [Muribaculaceae bacterium]
MKQILTISLLTIAATASQAQTTVETADGTVTLANGQTSVTFDAGKRFDILSMKHNGSRELVSPGDNTTPWTITYLGAQGETPEVTPATAVYRGYTTSKTDSAATLVFHWDTRLRYDGNNYPVEMSVSLPDNSSLLQWRVKASLPEGWKVSELKFPTVAVKSPREAKVITPAGWGNEYKLRADTIYEA